MSRVKVSEASGPVLDWMVAKCELPDARIDVPAWATKPWVRITDPSGVQYVCPHFSTDWAQGGPIIERERITLRVSTMPGTAWAAFYDVPGEYHARIREKGPTPLIAAMRCRVVHVPEELLA